MTEENPYECINLARFHELVDKKLAGTISQTEREELEKIKGELNKADEIFCRPMYEQWAKKNREFLSGLESNLEKLTEEVSRQDLSEKDRVGLGVVIRRYERLITSVRKRVEEDTERGY
ncbi:MAG: hypothetical protein AABX71_03485 [Nanoarchaeota archaeon]